MITRIILLLALLFGFSISAARGAPKEHIVTLDKKEITTVSKAVQLITLSAANYRKSGVRVEVPVRNKRGVIVRYAQVKKTKSRLRHVPPGTKVIIAARLVSTKTVDTLASQTAAQACRHLQGNFCEWRLAYFNGIRAGAQMPQQIIMPAAFGIAVPFAKQAQPKNTAPVVPPSPGRPWWFWPVIGLSIIVLVYVIFRFAMRYFNPHVPDVPV